jgi:hypothetical protein
MAEESIDRRPLYQTLNAEEGKSLLIENSWLVHNA